MLKELLLPIVDRGIYKSFVDGHQKGQKKLAVLLDPDKIDLKELEVTVSLAKEAQVDYFFIGGSLLIDDKLDFCLEYIKNASNIPMVIFPGSPLQINKRADGILLLSLISGRNADLLIGRHVEAVPFLKASKLEVMPTGYMLIDGGAPTTVSYISNTLPIPIDKPDIAACTAMAGEMLGLKLLYMDTGSGAKRHVSKEMVHMVSRKTDIPIIVGGGIRTPEVARELCLAGADILVVGNAIEKDPNLITDIASAIHNYEAIH